MAIEPVEKVLVAELAPVAGGAQRLVMEAPPVGILTVPNVRGWILAVPATRQQTSAV